MANKLNLHDLAADSWNLAINGDQERAARTLMNAQSLLARHAQRFGLADEDFEDVFLEIVFRFIQAAVKGKSVERPGIFLFALFTNALHDLQRRKKSAPQRLPESVEDMAEYQSELLGPEEEFERQERSGAVLRVLERFRHANPQSVEILELRLAGLRTGEIAQRLGIPVGEAMERMASATHTLRRMFAQELGDDDLRTVRPASAYAAAIARGQEFRELVSSSPGELLGHDQAIALLPSLSDPPTSVSTFAIAVSASDGMVRYPSWQFEDGVRQNLPRVLEALGASEGSWGQYLFFTQENPNLDGRTPLEALRVGDVDAVLVAAKAFCASEAGA